MSNRFGTALAFLAGATVGGAAVWYSVKAKYAQLAEEEIASVKAAYANREKEKATRAMEKYRGQEEAETQTPPASQNPPEKKGYTDYSKTVVPAKSEPSADTRDIPYVISPEEFDEIEEYTPISLTYFADGVLSDEYGVIVENVEELIGDALDHFGEYEDDSVYVRNDSRRCDYEILRDEREYAEFRKTLPPNI